jgi:hypothetical protein
LTQRAKRSNDKLENLNIADAWKALVGITFEIKDKNQRWMRSYTQFLLLKLSAYPKTASYSSSS